MDTKKNMETWEQLCTVPPEMLKNIGAGRLKGKSDINPQWRIKRMTEVFGPCGIGWRYQIEKLWTEPGGNGEVAAFALVTVWVGANAPIPGIGGSMLIEKEKEGLHTNDEAYKMAVTDAISVALKALGVAADIYLGLWDGSKYRDKPAGAAPAPAKFPKQDAPKTGDAHAQDDGDHFCSVHQCKFYRNEREGEVWYSHKIKGTNEYCREVFPPQAAAPAAPAQKAEPEPTFDPNEENW